MKKSFTVFLLFVFMLLDSIYVGSIVRSNITGPLGDYGDAPDDSQNPSNVFAYSGVVAKFPSFYDSKNVRVMGRKGCYHTDTSKCWLGNSSSTPTKENDALVIDHDTDNCEPIIIVNATTHKGYIIFYFTMKDAHAFVNVLLDLNHDGEWKNEDGVNEWIIVNREINLPDEWIGQTLRFIGGEFDIPYQYSLPVWARITITEESIDEELFSDVGGWDGSASSDGFSYGETEDWLITDFIPFGQHPDPIILKNMAVIAFGNSMKIIGANGKDNYHAEVSKNNCPGWWDIRYSHLIFGGPQLTLNRINVAPCPCNAVNVVGGLINWPRVIPPWWFGSVKNFALVPLPIPNGIKALQFRLFTNWKNPNNIPPPCTVCPVCGKPAHFVNINLIVDPPEDIPDYVAIYSPSLTLYLHAPEEFSFELISPEDRYAYLFGFPIMPFPSDYEPDKHFTIIIGSVFFSARAECSAGIERVDFYVDENLFRSDYFPPYRCFWMAPFGASWHNLTVVAHCKDGRMAEETRTIASLGFIPGYGE
ncbi:MAG: hypothetical protein J7K95_00450 [Thermoplasmata archaeon]|nr:hypothetical protein [Thermoplasmata archaeon]